MDETPDSGPDSGAAQMERQRRVDRDAAYWHVALDDSATPTRLARFSKWAQNVDHIQSFLETAFVCHELHGLPRRSRADLQPLIDAARVEMTTNVVPLAGPPASPVPAPRARRKRLLRAAAPIAAIMLLSLVPLLHPFRAHYSTTVGEQRSFRLTDGSTVYLNTDSDIRVHFTSHKREITLSRGEALFVVAPDALRSFVVVADDVNVKALGTQFNVYRDRLATRIYVVDGRVQVAVAAGLAQATPLAAGEEADIGPKGQVSKHIEPDTLRITAWRRRQFDFRSATLDEVAGQFNRYNATQIRIEDRALGAMQVNGVFSIDEPQVLLSFLAQDPNLAFERTADSIIIRPR